MRLDLVTLRVFISVFEEQSLARAAEREHLAPSALSKRLTDLEDQVKVKLFDRRSTGMIPTSAGAALIHHARMIMRNVSQLEMEMVDYSQGLRGVVRVYANTAAMVQYLPDDLPIFLRKHPFVRVHLEEATSPQALRAVEQNDAEIAIYGDVEVSSLTVLPYRRDRLVLLVPRSHPLARRSSIRFAEAVSYEFVGTPVGSSIDTALVRAAAEAGEPLRLRIRTAGFDAVSRMVRAGLGIAVIPELVSRSYMQTMPVQAILIEEAWAHRQLQICVRERSMLSPAAAAFVDHLTSQDSNELEMPAAG